MNIDASKVFGVKTGGTWEQVDKGSFSVDQRTGSIVFTQANNKHRVVLNPSALEAVREDVVKPKLVTA